MKIFVKILSYLVFIGVFVGIFSKELIGDKTGDLIIGISGFLGSIIANWTISYFSRRGLLIGGHFFMMVLHFLIFVFIIYGESCNSIGTIVFKVKKSQISDFISSKYNKTIFHKKTI